MHTFYLDPEEWRAPYTLRGDEAVHLGKVLRLRAGETVRLFDGRGREGTFRIAQVGKRESVLELIEEQVLPRPAHASTLAVAWTKSSRRGWLFEKVAEFEGAGIWLWQAERSQGKLPDEPKDAWLGQVMAGAKQSGNPWLPEVRCVGGGVAGLVRAAVEAGFARLVLLHEDPERGHALGPSDLASDEPTLYVIGPEGGFTDKEAEAFIQGGFAPVTLGTRVLRWETAALLCLGLAWWGAQLPSEDGRG